MNTSRGSRPSASRSRSGRSSSSRLRGSGAIFSARELGPGPRPSAVSSSLRSRLLRSRQSPSRARRSSPPSRIEHAHLRTRRAPAAELRDDN
jgi:hypothetical protein